MGNTQPWAARLRGTVFTHVAANRFRLKTFAIPTTESIVTMAKRDPRLMKAKQFLTVLFSRYPHVFAESGV